MEKLVELGAKVELKVELPGKALGCPPLPVRRWGGRPVRVAAPLALLRRVRRPETHRRTYLPLAASLSLEPAETLTL
jgi:hypothetical protein